MYVCTTCVVHTFIPVPRITFWTANLEVHDTIIVVVFVGLYHGMPHHCQLLFHRLPRLGVVRQRQTLVQVINGFVVPFQRQITVTDVVQNACFFSRIPHLPQNSNALHVQLDRPVVMPSRFKHGRQIPHGAHGCDAPSARNSGNPT